MGIEEIIRSGFASLSLPCPETVQERYRLFYQQLEAENKVMNLTAISGQEDVARLHFLDCAALLPVLELEGKRVIDVGSGAGFPGLALKIAQEDMQLYLLDSLDKRVGFLRRVCQQLDFSDVICVHARAEEPPENYRESFDVAMSRAVARLNVLSELCLPYVKPGGVFVAMKGPDCQDELDEAKAAITLLGGKTERIYKYTIPGTDISHSAVVIRKTGKTPPRYPRRWAIIKKTPLS